MNCHYRSLRDIIVIVILLPLPLYLSIGQNPNPDSFTPGTLNPDAPPETAQFGQLAGVWSASQQSRHPDGSWSDPIEGSEWRFYYILDGHAIQDDWISLSPEGSDLPPFLGTNIRIYNPNSKQWEIAWFDTGRRTMAHYTAKAAGDSIIMTGTESSGRKARNTFHSITDDTFYWRKEWTFDEGQSWTEVARIVCRRKS